MLDAAPPATVEDIFADIETLVALVPDEREKESLQSAMLNMQKEYQRAYAEGEEKREKWGDDWLDDIRNPEKYLQFSLMTRNHINVRIKRCSNLWSR